MGGELHAVKSARVGGEDRAGDSARRTSGAGGAVEVGWLVTAAASHKMIYRAQQGIAHGDHGDRRPKKSISISSTCLPMLGTDTMSDAIIAAMTPDCVFEASMGPDIKGARHLGREQVRAAVEAVLEQFPDARWSGPKHFIAGDRGVTEWVFSGTRPDGTRVEVQGCDVFTFRNGKIAVKNSVSEAADRLEGLWDWTPGRLPPRNDQHLRRAPPRLPAARGRQLSRSVYHPTRDDADAWR